MSNKTLSDEEKKLLEKHENDLKQFHNLKNSWEELAEKMGCDVDTAHKIYAHYEREHAVGPIR